MKLQSLIGHLHELLLLVRATPKPADSIIDAYFRKRKYLGSKERKFLATGTYGILRHLRLCEYYLQRALTGRLDDLTHEDGMLFLILTYLIRIDSHTILEQDVRSNLLSSSGRACLPVLLERLPQLSVQPQADSNGDLALRYSYSDWMVKKFTEGYGEEVEQLCRVMNEQALIQIRVNTLKTSLEDCQERLAQEHIQAQQHPVVPNCLTLEKRINIFGLQAFKEGWFEMQDAGSQVIPQLIDPKPTAKLLDACAGAGGKTLAFAALMNNRGEIVASDIHSYRLEELRRRLKRAGADTIRIKQVNALSDLQSDYTGYFDIVFIDAPCSGSGTIRRNPGMKWSITESLVRSMAEKQLSIIEQCAPLVKSGGRLVYATCSLFSEENEQVVQQFLHTHREFEFAPFTAIPAFEGIAAPLSVVMLVPHRHNTDGFFCASLRRTC